MTVKKSAQNLHQMFELKAEQNFFSFSDSDYLDKEFNEISSPDSDFRIINIHASPIDWNGNDSVMLTFEDVTSLNKKGDSSMLFYVICQTR